MTKDTTETHYAFWAERSRKSSLGAKLKAWVERTYLADIARARARAGEPDGAYSLLEIGPGNGDFAREALGRGVAYAAIESSPPLAASLRERGVECLEMEFPGDIGALGGRRFDCVYLSHVLEHQDTRREAVAFVGGVKAVLRPGGICVVNCPNVLSHGLLFWVSDYTHNYVTTPLRVRNLLFDQGFEILLDTRMRFGVQNAVLRRLLAVVGTLLQPWMLLPVMQLFVPGYQGDPRIYFRENFTIIARLPEAA